MEANFVNELIMTSPVHMQHMNRLDSNFHHQILMFLWLYCLCPLDF